MPDYKLIPNLNEARDDGDAQEPRPAGLVAENALHAQDLRDEDGKESWVNFGTWVTVSDQSIARSLILHEKIEITLKRSWSFEFKDV